MKVLCILKNLLYQQFNFCAILLPKKHSNKDHLLSHRKVEGIAFGIQHVTFVFPRWSGIRDQSNKGYISKDIQSGHSFH